MVRMRWVGRVAVILMVALMCKKIGFTVRRETNSLGRTEEMIVLALMTGSAVGRMTVVWSWPEISRTTAAEGEIACEGLI